MNFDSHVDHWSIHFISEDCQTPISNPTRRFRLSSLDALRAFLIRCNPEDGTLSKFEHSVRAWGRGSEYVNLTAEQYAKLKNTKIGPMEKS